MKVNLEIGRVYIGGKNKDQRKLIEDSQYRNQIVVEVLSGSNKGEKLNISRGSFLNWLRTGKSET